MGFVWRKSIQQRGQYTVGIERGYVRSTTYPYCQTWTEPSHKYSQRSNTRRREVTKGRSPILNKVALKHDGSRYHL